MGQQQAALEQLFPDMRPQAPQPPLYPQRQDQQPQLLAQQQQPAQLIAAATPMPPTDDILAGDIEQLNGHLHTARFCNTHKAAHPFGVQTPAAAGPPPPNGSAYAGGQSQPAQQRRADVTGFVPSHERSRPKERHDRWAGTNGMYPSGGARLAQSNSPPMTPAYAQSHGMPVPAHLLQYHFPGHLFIPPNRDLRHSQHQHQHQHHPHPHQQRQQAHMHGQYQYQQPVAMPPWQPHPPRASSVDDLHRSGSAAGSTDAGPATQPQPPPVIAPSSSSSLSHGQHAVDTDGSLAGTSGWEEASRSSMPLLPDSSSAQLPIGVGPAPFRGGPSASHGPATVDSPPAPKGIWGDGLHQQRLTNLANDLANVRVTSAMKPSAEAAAAGATGKSDATRKEAPSSSRSAGSTPHAGDSHRPRGNFPFDNPAALNKRRQRLPYNASAQELSQSASGNNGGPEAPPKRERTAKLSLDSLTSQAEAAQRQRALAGFELKTDDFPALGGMRPGPSIPASPGISSGNRAPYGKAWSETDALGPPVHKSQPD